MIPAQVRRDVYRRDRWRCAHCGKTQHQHQRETVDNHRLHIHHIWPRNDGGKETRTNLITLCRKCHAQTEAHAKRIIRAYPEDEARRRVRWATVKYVRCGHPLSTRWKKAERRRHRRHVGHDPATV